MNKNPFFHSAFNRVGFSELQERYMEAIPAIRNENTTCGLPEKEAFHVFLDPVTGAQPWPGLLVVSTIGCVYYWCCDQVSTNHN